MRLLERYKPIIYRIIFYSDTPLGKLFDVVLLWCIVLSISILLKTTFTVAEYVFTFFFTLAYLLRIYCSPKPRDYVFSFFGVVDLLATLPLYIGWFFGPVRYLMIVRTFRLIRVFRVFKLFSFLEEGDNLLRSLRLSFRKIMVFFLFIVIMVISLGTLMYMVEGDEPGSQYWAVVTMTTGGYGDIAPVTTVGRMLSAIVMLLGYTIMAVPTGIVSAQFIHDSQHKGKAKCPECGGPLRPEYHYCPHCGRSAPQPQLPTQINTNLK